MPSFRTPEWRPFRAGMFVAMGASAVVPVLHGISLFGVAQLEQQMGLFWLVLQGLLYISGAAIYAVSTILPSSIIHLKHTDWNIGPFPRTSEAWIF